jgi:hypothetical protein
VSRLDELLSSAGSSDPASLERMRASLQAELTKPPPRSWRVDVVLLLAAAWGAGLAVGIVLLVAGQTTASLLSQHAAAFAWLFLTGALAASAAIAPRSTFFRVAGPIALAAGPVGLVLLRLYAGGAASAAPPWVCTVSHLAVGLVPLAVGVVVLKRSAPSGTRALFCGVAAGTAGALLGELGCGQDWLHVAVFHVSAWLLVAAATALVGLRVKRSSYAP